MWPGTAGSREATLETVPSVDVAACVHANVHGRSIPGKLHEDDPEPCVISKMDIEGSEYEVLGKMMLTGAVCNMTLLTLEWHPALLCPACEQQTVERMLRHSLTAEGCTARVMLVDDESYSYRGRT